MIYTQKDYPQLNDETGEGSLIIAFANLLDRFGKTVDPLTLKSEMATRGIVEAMFGSVSIVESAVQVSSFGAPGVPSSNNAIMKFEYLSNVTDKITTHYCLVIDAEKGTILDSYSGTEKSWHVYSGPGAWATYSSTIVAAPAPTPTPELVKVVDNTAPVEPLPEDDSVIIPVKVKPVDIYSWQGTFKPYLGVLDCTAVLDKVIRDEAGTLPDTTLVAGTLVPIGGKFEKDGVTYYRTAKSIENDTWYGIPAGTLIRTDRLDEDADIQAIFDTPDESTKDKVIKTAATIEGKTKKFFSFGKTK